MIDAHINHAPALIDCLALTRCLGTRQLLDEEDEAQPNGKVFKKWKMGIYTWLSYVEVDEMSTNLGKLTIFSVE